MNQKNIKYFNVKFFLTAFSEVDKDSFLPFYFYDVKVLANAFLAKQF